VYGEGLDGNLRIPGCPEQCEEYQLLGGSSVGGRSTVARSSTVSQNNEQPVIEKPAMRRQRGS